MTKHIYLSEEVNLTRLAKINHFAQNIYESNPENPKMHFMDISNPEVLSFLKNLHETHVEYSLSDTLNFFLKSLIAFARGV